MIRPLLLAAFSCVAIRPLEASGDVDAQKFPVDSPQWREVAHRAATAPPPKVSLVQALRLVRGAYPQASTHSQQKIFLSSVRLVLVSEPAFGQPTATPFWEVVYSWNYRPDWESEIYYVTMDGKVTSLIVRH